MAIVKGAFDAEFVTVYNKTARDTRLSLQARGLLIYLLSLPGGWRVSRNQLASDNHVNNKTIQKYLNELKEFGYACYRSVKENGRFVGGDYHIFPTPQETIERPPEKPAQPSKTAASTGDPKSGSPKTWVAGEAGQHIKKETNKEINKKTTTTGKLDFDVFALALLSLIREMLAEGGWTPTGQPAPKATWLKAKAERLYNKFADPRPEDCAALILKDWTALINGRGKAG